VRAPQQFSGTLALFSVPEAIQFISGGSKSGVLRFSTPNPDLELRLFMKAGRIVGLSGRSVPRLSEVLLKQGIPADVVGRLGMEMSQNKNPDALKTLVRGTLETALERRLMIGLLPIWEEREGSFEFAPSDDPPVTLEPGLVFENIAFEVARRTDEFGRSLLNISPDDVYAIAERIGDFSERIAHLRAQDWSLVNLIDGEHSLAQIGMQAVLSFDQVANAIAALEAAGLIELRSAQRGQQIKYSRLQAGDLAPAFTLPTLDGSNFSLGALRGKRTLLAFHRHAGCPYCNLRVHELINAHPQLERAGVQVVAVFGSSQRPRLARTCRTAATTVHPGRRRGRRDTHPVRHATQPARIALTGPDPKMARGIPPRHQARQHRQSSHAIARRFPDRTRLATRGCAVRQERG
jgi:hypothetical protein